MRVLLNVVSNPKLLKVLVSSDKSVTFPIQQVCLDRRMDYIEGNPFEIFSELKNFEFDLNMLWDKNGERVYKNIMNNGVSLSSISGYSYAMFLNSYFRFDDNHFLFLLGKSGKEVSTALHSPEYDYNIDIRRVQDSIKELENKRNSDFDESDDFDYDIDSKYILDYKIRQEVFNKYFLLWERNLKRHLNLSSSELIDFDKKILRTGYMDLLSDSVVGVFYTNG